MNNGLKTLSVAFSLAIAWTGMAGASTVSPAFNVDPNGHAVHEEGPGHTMWSPESPETTLLSTLHAGHDHGSDDRWCGTDISSPEARKLIGQYLADRRAGRYPTAAKGGSDPDIGDRQVFNVSEDSWMELEFELVDKTDLYHLWVEVAELGNGNVTQTKIDQLKASVHDATPSRSINPGQGTFANIHDVFGLPPNIDGDGFVDVLMYDIGRGSGSTLGYVHPADLVLDPPDGVGNQRDILYLDSNEGTRNLATLSVIAAHEYTHLVHQSYGSDQTFISEGLAEYAMVMNGFYWRGVNFVSMPSEVSLPLFTWRSDQGSVGARGYERGGLFFTYIAEQHGPTVVGQMLRDTEKKGAPGMDSVLTMNGSSLSDVILDYHTANRVNDESIDPRFGYNEPERSSHHAFLSSPPVNGEIESGTGEEAYSFEFEENINSGAVHYLQITNVSDFRFVYDTPDPTGIFYGEKSQRNRARILMEDESGSLSIRDVDPGVDQVTLDGEYKSLTFILIHERPEIAVGDRSSLVASWTPLSMATDVDAETGLPASFGLDSVYPNPFSNRANVSTSLSEAGPVMVEVIDVLGRVESRTDHGVLPAGTHVLHVDGSDLPAGSYLIRLISGSNADSHLVTVAR